MEIHLLCIFLSSCPAVLPSCLWPLASAAFQPLLPPPTASVSVPTLTAEARPSAPFSTVNVMQGKERWRDHSTLKETKEM